MRLSRARCGERGGAALDERSAVRSERRLVHVPAVGVGELHLSFYGALGGRHACDGARRRLLVGVGGARRADVPHWRRGAPRGVGQLECDRVQRDACSSGRGSYRGEQQRAGVHVERGASAAGVAACARRAAVERSGGWRDGGERALSRHVARRSAVPVWRWRSVSRLAEWRVSPALRDVGEQHRHERLGRRAADELPRRACERRQLLLPLRAASEQRDAARRP